MATVHQITTAAELLAAGDIGRCELIGGELVMMAPAGFNHGWIGINIATELRNFVKPRRLGRVLNSDTGFFIRRNPDTVRAPDVSFVRADRVPPGGIREFFPGAPDLAVEVLSPDDRPGEVQDKVCDWLDSGCTAVWVVNPKTRTVSIHRRNSETATLTEDQVITCEDLLQGFSVAVAEFFSP
jgi:Uma2 family endonuclease